MTPYTVRIGLCKVSGKHLSEAPNAPTFAEIDAECQADARAIVRDSLALPPGWWDERNDRRAMRLQQQHSDFQDVIDRRNGNER